MLRFLHFPLALCAYLSPLLTLGSPLPTLGTTIEASKPSSNETSNFQLRREACKNPAIRKEWRTLSDHTKLNFLYAVRCLQKKPGRYTDLFNGAIPRTTRYEDFIYVHKSLAPSIHYSSLFLPWHRLYLQEFENTLYTECGYRGAMPYWDMALDIRNTPMNSTSPTGYSAEDFEMISPVFLNSLGFGGPPSLQDFAYTDIVDNENLSDTPPVSPPPPVSGEKCVPGGYFAYPRYKVRIGPTSTTTREDRCLSRELRPFLGKLWMTEAREEDLMRVDNFVGFWRTLEGGTTFLDVGVHGGSHGTVGGTAADPWVSPADPLFYLFHANLDRMWWRWQRINPEKRNFWVDGSLKPWNPFFGQDPSSFPDRNITLTDTIDLERAGQSRKVEEVVSTRFGALCYEYE